MVLAMLVFSGIVLLHVLLVVATEPAPSSTDSNSEGSFKNLDKLTMGHVNVTMQVMDEKFGCAVARIVLPRLVMHTRYYYGLAFPKGLNSAPGRPRVAPSSPVIFEVTLEYVPGLDNE
ncbi:hypothetical protein ZIOFF_001593 [Zingiber officinale]|uniref:Peptidylprolyl isomerase n=1 Tax=Zingiber officinale TaxID=94328 RepID=A0A8J5M7U7_ZINOF|nr:hypothetical protein ZIOFF_001593 [Zingiber officinale]